ncbi:MAG: S49 family peptidase [Gammaproteobacteria bacterium]|nr:S49 family peptidase [Gammaproteobacteria bacterium]
MADIQANSNGNISEDLVRDLIKERKRDRLWRNIRFFLGFVFIILVFMMAFGGQGVSGSIEGKDYISLVRLDGLIAPGKEFSAEQVLPTLKDAFSDKRAKGVIIDINSGGGTPVQASIIHDEILALKKRYNKKVVVVGEDMLASGAYFVAVSGDKIYVNPNTITGSIGVIMQGFGFVDGIKKLGVDRRVITSGINKDRLDPFLPQNVEDVNKIKTVIDEVHQNFNQAVLKGRAGKLKGDQKELFSGDFWTGQTALQLGLVDGLGNLSDVMESEFHVSRYKDYSENNPLKKLVTQLGAALNLPLSDLDQHVLAKI